MWIGRGGARKATAKGLGEGGIGYNGRAKILLARAGRRELYVII